MEKIMLKFLLFIALLLFQAMPAFANGLSLTSVTLGAQNTTTHTYDIQFNVSWDNSWYISGAPSPTANWDAAWVFAKFSVWNAGTQAWGNWTHCTLSKTNADHTAPTGSQIASGCSPSAACGGGDTGKGVFIYRNAAGTGTVSLSGAALRWLYGTDGVGDTDKVKVHVFGIEMVYIPSGPFYIGDPDNAYAANFRWADGTAGAPLINSGWSGAINASSANNSSDDDQLRQPGAGLLISGAGGIKYADGTNVHAAFPTGYNAFYIMKYDVSQRQWVDFLNTLTRPQQTTRTASQAASQFVMSNSASVAYRDGVRAPSSIPAGSITFGNDLNTADAFNQPTDGQWIAMNDLSWMDQAAYVAWAGLRPFTELEFEKACRGGQTAVGGEYAWGDATVDTATTSLANGGANNETPNNGNLNYTTSTPDGPFRAGSFAGAATTRHASGAGYYGVMDLSGQLLKRPVTVGNTTGRAFTGTHGSGALATSGNATNSDWPGYGSGEVSAATGSGFRGGAWNYAATRVSDRQNASLDYAARVNTYGARAARTSP